MCFFYQIERIKINKGTYYINPISLVSSSFILVELVMPYVGERERDQACTDLFGWHGDRKERKSKGAACFF